MSESDAGNDDGRSDSSLGYSCLLAYRTVSPAHDIDEEALRTESPLTNCLLGLAGISLFGIGLVFGVVALTQIPGIGVALSPPSSSSSD